jgi:hypothetical protein
MGQVTEIMNTSYGPMIISVILGLGLATLFRRVCEDKQCMVVKSPNSEDIEKYYYKLQNDCYQYTPETVECILKK